MELILYSSGGKFQVLALRGGAALRGICLFNPGKGRLASRCSSAGDRPGMEANRYCLAVLGAPPLGCECGFQSCVNERLLDPEPTCSAGAYPVVLKTDAVLNFRD